MTSTEGRKKPFRKNAERTASSEAGGFSSAETPRRSSDDGEKRKPFRKGTGSTDKSYSKTGLAKSAYGRQSGSYRTASDRPSRSSGIRLKDLRFKGDKPAPPKQAPRDFQLKEVVKKTLTVEIPAAGLDKLSVRRQARILAMQALYAWDVQKELGLEILGRFDWVSEHRKDAEDFARELIKGSLEKYSEIDEIIKPRLVNWDFDRISRVNKSILRLSIFCLLHRKDLPAKVTLDEAVDLAKMFGDKDDYKFINAILDRIRHEYTATAETQKKT